MKIKKLSDKKCLALFQELISDRVRLGTAYISDEETGILTHQFLVITCGDLRLESAPELLTLPLVPVVPKNEMVN